VTTRRPIASGSTTAASAAAAEASDPSTPFGESQASRLPQT
jgi:hypothetical protein